MHTRTVLIACLGFLLAVPATAAGATVTLSGGTLTYRGGSAANQLEVTVLAGLHRVRDGATVNAGNGCVQVTSQEATCSGAVNAVSVNGDTGADNLRVLTLAAPTVTGGSGNDQLTIGDSGGRLSGSAGDDVLTGGAGVERTNGGDGRDRLIGNAGPDRLNGDDDADEIDGGTEDDVLRGGSGADRIAGGNEKDRVEGGSGDDVLDGGLGPDVFDGGSGRDTADYGARTAPVFVDLDGNPDDGEADEGDNVTNDVERIVGGAANDRLTAITGARDLIGGGGDDVLTGGRGADGISGGEGNDTLAGELSDDSLDGGDGVDTADYTGRFDEVRLDLTHATATLERGNPTSPRRNTERDSLRSIENGRGTSRADVLIGDGADNVLEGGSGPDTLTGGAGADVLSGGAGRDTATYRARRTGVGVTLDDVANDGVPGENDDVRSTVENVLGGAGNDTIFGNARRNGLNGGPGGDLLLGAEGADRIVGGRGADRVDAGPGRDLLALRDGTVDRGRCGDGPDVLVADRRDRVGGCERRR